MRTNTVSVSSNVSPVMEELRVLGVDPDVDIIEVDCDGYMNTLVVFIVDLLAMSGAWWLDNPQRRIRCNPTVNLGSDVSLGNCVSIGDNVTIGDGSVIGKNATVATGCTVGSGAVIGADVVIGMGAIVSDGVTIGSNAVVGAWSVITKDIPNNRVVPALMLH